MFKKIIILFLFIFQFNFSQILDVELSNNVIGVNETFEIKFSIDGKGSNFVPPNFSENFTLISGPMRSSSTSIINGSMTQETSYTYVLRANKIGVFTILPANIRYKGKTIGSKPITVQVKKSTSKKTNTPYKIASRKIHLVVSSNKKTCYVGEPVVLTYKIYFNLNIGGLNQKKVEYNGFWTESVDISTETKKANFKGENYNYATISQVVLIPQSSGLKKITPMEIELVASIPSNRRDFFGMLTSQNIDLKIASNDLQLTVLDLPKENKPTSFSGAVGEYDFELKLEKNKIEVNESCLLNLIISGYGNLNLLTAPQLKLSNNIEVFESKSNDKIIFNSRGISGKKIDEYLLVPRYKGNYVIDPITFTYFDPNKKEYITLDSDALKINVIPSKYNIDETVSKSDYNKEKIDILSDDIRYIKVNPSNDIFKENFIKSNIFLVLLIIPIIVLLFVILIFLNIIDVLKIFPSSVIQKVNQRLNIANKLFNDEKFDELFSHLLDTMFFYCEKRLFINKSDLKINNISNIMINKKIEKKLVNEFSSYVKQFESYNYSKKKRNLDNIKHTITQLKELIIKIDNQL